MGRGKKSNYIKIIFGIIIIAAFAIFGYDLNNKIDENLALQEDLKIQSINNDVDNIAVEKKDNNLKIHYIDQTTPNMIQRISGVFERKPLILKEI